VVLHPGAAICLRQVLFINFITAKTAETASGCENGIAGIGNY